MTETAVQPVEASKKRKRTGKQREEAKRLAIQAKLDAEAKPEPLTEVQDESLAGTSSVVEAAQEVQPTMDLDKLVSRIPTALKHLHPTFKQARTFETRRLIKKIRFLRSKPASAADATDLEAQLALLSHLPLNPTIQSHMLVKLRKHPKLKHTLLPSSAVDLLTPPLTPSSSDSSMRVKVENRICSSKTVAEAVKSTVGWLVGDEGAKLVSREAQRTKSASAAVRSKDSGRLRQSGGAGRGDESDGGEDASEDGGDELEDDEGDAALDARIAADDTDDEGGQERLAADAAGWESGSVSDIDDPAGGRHPEVDTEDGDSEFGDSEHLPPAKRATPRTAKQLSAVQAVKLDKDPPQPVDAGKSGKETKGAKAKSGGETKVAKEGKATKATKVAKEGKVGKGDKEAKPARMGAPPREPITSSTFLPTLWAGFTLGSDDSDPDLEYDSDGIVGSATPERKNRRGQRARQAIWEKKYGSGAKHVVKAREAAHQQQHQPHNQQHQQHQQHHNQHQHDPHLQYPGDRGQTGDRGQAGRGRGTPGRGMTADRGWGARGGPSRGGFTTHPHSQSTAVPTHFAHTQAHAHAHAPTPTPKPAANKSLHPSWEAARLRKQKEMAAAPRSTKIVFD